MTERLQVVGIDEQRPHAAVRDDMIHIGGASPLSTEGTCAAVRLTPKLIGTHVILEDWQRVPLVPVRCRRASAGGVLRLVLWTVHLPRQHAAADMCARSEWLLCHGLSPPGKTKAPEPSHLSVIIGSGALAQAHFVDIHDGLFPAVLAVDCDLLALRPRQDPQHLLALANRAEQISISCHHFTTHRFRLQ